MSDYVDENLILEKTQRELTALGDPNLGLNTHRFRLGSEASREFLTELRAFYTRESKVFPEFLGIGFFGSQVKGYASEGSDWDLVLLFDEDKSTYSDIGDSLTVINREVSKISERSINPIFCVNSEQRMRLFLSILKRLVLDFKSTSLSDEDNRTMNELIENLAFLYLPYIGNLSEIHRFRSIFFKCLDDLPVDDESKEKIWRLISSKLFVIENQRTIPAYSDIQDHPRWGLYHHLLQEAKKYYLKEK